MHRSLPAAALVALPILFASCDSSVTPATENVPLPPSGKMFLGTATSVLQTRKLEAVVWASDSLRTGWNVVHVELRDPRFPDSAITDAHLKCLPWMTMPGKAHGGPGENLGADTVDGMAVRGGFRLGAVFQMPSGPMGSWKLRVRVHDHRYVGSADSALQNDTLVLPVTVGASAPSRVATFLGSDGVRRIVAWIAPSTPKVGDNALELGMWSMKDSVSFPGDSAVRLEFEPTMPSMGHGSDGNVQPVARRKGHYHGKAVFTMTGDWRIALRVSDGSRVLDSTGAFGVVVR